VTVSTYLSQVILRRDSRSRRCL